MATTSVTAGFATPAEGPLSQPPVASPHEAGANDEAAGAAAVVAAAPATAAGVATATAVVAASVRSLFFPSLLRAFSVSDFLRHRATFVKNAKRVVSWWECGQGPRF